MRICHVGTFWPFGGGHTHYTDNLIRGIRSHDPARHLVVAERSAVAAETADYECVPCFSRRGDYVDDVTRTAVSRGAELAVFQYSDDVFGDDNRFPRLLERLRQQGIVTVVNSHSIYPERRRTRYRPGRTAAAFDRALAANTSMFTVHSSRMRADLLARGIPASQVTVIPHGTKSMPEADRLDCRRQLGIPLDAKVVLFFGFVWLGKGIEFLLDVFARVQKRIPEAFLYIGGHTSSKVWSLYMTYLRARLVGLGVAKRARFWGGYVPEAMVPVIYSAADVVAMPYRQDYSSVSGVVHQTAGIGKLMLCSRIAKFDEVTERIDPSLTVEPRDTRGWVDGLVRLLEDPAYGEAMRAKIRAFGAETSWERVGARQLELFRRLMAVR